VLEAAKSETAQTAATSANALLLRVIAELGDAADDDGIHPKQLAELGCRVGVRTIAIGEILLGQNLVHGLPLDDGIGAVLHQVFDQQIGDTFADIHVLPEDRGHAAVDGRIIEVKNCHAFLARRRRCLGHRRTDTGNNQQNGEDFPEHNSFHRSSAFWDLGEDTSGSVPSP